jgi:putative DNA primase/helicase
VDVARGRWRGLLSRMGVPATLLSGKHGPCPSCGGVDRFRFTDHGGDGRWICNQCGHGSGFDLLRMVKGWEFKQACREIEAIVGEVPASGMPPSISPDDIRKRLRATFMASKRAEPDDVVHRYLAARGLTPSPFPHALRTCQALRCDGTDLPAMLAVVSDAAGKPATLHRTFLAPDGSAKANVKGPRRLMPGSVPKGAAIRLGEHTGRLGVAEGIETALAASALFGLPVWSTINSAMLSTWEPPEDVTEIVVFGDHDPKFGGHAAAYALAHRLACSGITLSVEIPPEGDWNDALLAAEANAARAEPMKETV